jgi:DNA-binding NtrC family response regulator
MNRCDTDRHVMIVEDDAGTRRSLETLFARRGWTVHAAGTVAEAERRLEEGPEPDALILDLLLPDGSGATVLRRVRAAGLGTRVAVYTGGGNPVAMMQVRALKPDLLLIKPVAADVLCNLCTRWAAPDAGEGASERDDVPRDLA